jgi:hypothetical protein
MKYTHTATLDIPQLSKSAKTAHIFPAMENNSLLSVGQLCDEGYIVLFSIDEVRILNEKQKESRKEKEIVPQDYGESICIMKNPIATLPRNNLRFIQPIVFMPYVIQVH